MTMRSMARRALVVLVPAAAGAIAFAQTASMPLDVKTGLWETTVTTTSTVNGTSTPPQTRTNKSCMTPARQQAGVAGAQEDARAQQAKAGMNCKQDITNQTATSLDAKMHCTIAQMPNSAFDGTTHMEVVSKESMKSNTTITMNGQMQMTTHVETTSKWIGADCGDIK